MQKVKADTGEDASAAIFLASAVTFVFFPNITSTLKFWETISGAYRRSQEFPLGEGGGK